MIARLIIFVCMLVLVVLGGSGRIDEIDTEDNTVCSHHLQSQSAKYENELSIVRDQMSQLQSKLLRCSSPRDEIQNAEVPLQSFELEATSGAKGVNEAHLKFNEESTSQDCDIVDLVGLGQFLSNVTGYPQNTETDKKCCEWPGIFCDYSGRVYKIDFRTFDDGIAVSGNISDFFIPKFDLPCFVEYVHWRNASSELVEHAISEFTARSNCHQWDSTKRMVKNVKPYSTILVSDKSRRHTARCVVVDAND